MAEPSAPERKDAPVRKAAADAHPNSTEPPFGLGRLSVGQKLWLAAIVFAALWFAHLTVSNIGSRDVRDLTAVVDAAGRLRMLSQRTALLALDSPNDRAALDAALADARKQLAIVRDKAFPLTAENQHPGIDRDLRRLSASWDAYSRTLSAIYDSAVKVPPNRVRTQSSALLDKAQKLVERLRQAQVRRQTVLDLTRQLIYLLGLIVLCMVCISVYYGGVRPLRQLARMARALERGELDHRVAYRARDEVGEVVRAFNAAAARIGTLLHSVSAERDALTEERQREARLFESVADGIIVVDDTGHIQRMNTEAERIFGYSRDELQGETVSALLPESLRDNHDLTMRRYLADPQARAMGNNRRIRGLHRDGTVIPVDIRLSPVKMAGRLYVIAAVRDVSVQRRAEAVRNRLAQTLDATSDLVLVFHPDGSLWYANPAAENLLQLKPDALTGRRVHALLTARHRRVFETLGVPGAITNGRWTGDLSFRVPGSDEELPVSCVIIAHRDEDDALEGLSLIARDISSELSYQRELEFQATHDELTGLPNRKVFDDRLQMELRRCHREGTRCAVVFVDMDNFKLVNDTLGHAAGDELLRVVAGRLKSGARESDTVVRFGGDEFAVVLGGVDDVESAASAAQRLLEATAHPAHIGAEAVAVTVSLGISVYPDHAGDCESLVRQADAAMFQSKGQGRNRVSIHSPELERAAAETLELQNSLPAAIQRGELVLHYQPMVRAQDGEVCGHEALIRWPRDDGLIPPSQFIPYAESQGLVGAICDWTLQDACRQAAEWRRSEALTGRVAVNISAVQLAAGSLEETVIKALGAARLPPECLELELTETAVLEHPTEAAAQFRRLRELGVRLAIDDFGAGYSGLANLAALPVDKIKIDRSLVQQSGNRHVDLLLDTIIGLCHRLATRVVAEGVETQAQADLLRDLGCDELQGFLFAYPAPPEQIVAHRLPRPGTSPLD